MEKQEDVAIIYNRWTEKRRSTIFCSMSL